jgi:hypothetical protein
MRNVRKPDRFIEYVEGVAVTIQCARCRQVKNSCDFSKSKSHSTGYMSSCKSCLSIESKKYYKKNSVRIRTYVKKYCIENKEEVLRKKKIYTKKRQKELQKNKDYREKRKAQAKSWRIRNNEKVKAYNKKYKTENAELCRDISRRRISSKRTTNLNLDNSIKNELVKLANKVKYLNKKEGYRAFHLDHIIPLNHPDVCGLHVPWNLQILTYKENCSKSNKFDGTYINESWRSEV